MQTWTTPASVTAVVGSPVSGHSSVSAVAPPTQAAPATASRGSGKGSGAQGEINLDVLTDKVQRKLLRRLAAEAERKGGFG